MSHHASFIAATDHSARSRSNSFSHPPGDPELAPQNGHVSRKSSLNVRKPSSLDGGLRPPASGPSPSNLSDIAERSGLDTGRSSPESLYHPELQPQDITESVGDRLRVDIQFFFMDPVRKWRLRRQIPWKLIIQVLKVVFVTIQLSLFGSMRVSHVTYLEETRTVFRHLFLKDWDTTRDIKAYPPPNGYFAAFTYAKFFERLNYAISAFNTINETAIGSFDHRFIDDNSGQHVPKPAELCITEYAKGIVFPSNSSYIFNTTRVTRCLEIPMDFVNHSDGELIDFLAENNGTVHFDKLIWAELSMDIKTVHLRNLEPYSTPDCFLMHVTFNMDNSQHSGQLVMDIVVKIDFISVCHGPISFATDVNRTKALIDVLDIVVIFCCICSFLLCTRALFRGYQLKRRTKLYFRSEMTRDLSSAGRLAFLNLWWVAIIINDVLIILGTIFKMSIEFRYFDSDLFTATAILLGTGDLLVWCGILRYLGFFAHYNVMILTLKKAFPNIMRFMLCASLVYFGFAFCGWVILGPYHYKFRDFMTTSECLFSLVNGDDMFATFDTTSGENRAVFWFARVYIYTFVSLFIYFILSLFIAIIMDAYEVIKEVYERKDGKSDLLTFLMEPSPTVPEAPGLGIDTMSDGSASVYHSSSVSRHGFSGWLYRCCRPAADEAPAGEPAYEIMAGE